VPFNFAIRLQLLLKKLKQQKLGFHKDDWEMEGRSLCIWKTLKMGYCDSPRWISNVSTINISTTLDLAVKTQ
jgi:hypothetical protein